MVKLMRVFCFFVALAAFADLQVYAADDDYGYPDINGFAATIVGTPEELSADLKIKPKIKLYGLEVFPDSKLLDALGPRLVKEAEEAADRANDPDAFEALEALNSMGYAGEE